MFNNWKHVCAVVGSLLAVTGPFLKVIPSWSYLLTPTGAGEFTIILGGWLLSLLTYSLLNDPIGAPQKP